jgi:hypothetical protein
MSSPALSLNPIVNISVYVTPQSAVSPRYNVGLIVGNSAVIPSVGANSRIRTYTGTAGMLTDGFSPSSPEYIAAQLYFSQTPIPTQLQIGRQDATSIATVQVHAASEGTGYLVGDILTVVQGGASAGTVRVTTIGGSGTVTGVSLVTDGTGYSVANGLATTGGTGSGAQVDITLVGETPLVAITACRAASSLWWAVMCTTAIDADHLAIAAYVQSMQPVGAYFYTTSDVAVLNNQAGNIGATMKAASYTRVFGDFGQTSTFAANQYSCAAAMGVMMGLNTGLANSYFTMKFKVLTGIVPEPLTTTQIAAIEGNNINVYVGYVNAYVILEQGTTPVTGTFIDQVLNRDILGAACAYNIMNVLTSLPSVPQTDPGQTLLLHAVNQAGAAAVVSGYLAPGTWEGPNLLVGSNGTGLATGNPLPSGFLALSPPYNTQTPAAKAARQAMPIYFAINEAGAVHSVVMGIYIQ